MTVSRGFAFGLIVFSTVVMSACGGIGSQDDSTKAQVLRDSKTLETRYNIARGTYKGQLALANATPDQQKVSATLFVYVVPIIDGRHADGTPKVRPELHARFRLDNFPTETDVTNMVGDYDQAGTLSLAAAATVTTTGTINPISVVGQMLNNQVTATVTRQGGVWGAFTGTQVSKDASAPAEGDLEEERERLRKLYLSVEGTYTAKIRSPSGNGFGVEIVVSQTDQPITNGGVGTNDQVLMPSLAAHFRRLDVTPGNGIGEYTMRVDYDALTGTVVMQSISPDKAIPGSAQYSIRGTLIKHVLKGSVRNANGYLGSVEARATNIPPQF